MQKGGKIYCILLEKGGISETGNKHGSSCISVTDMTGPVIHCTDFGRFVYNVIILLDFWCKYHFLGI